VKGAKELKRRVKGVKNIEHITRAMKMVAASKFKRAQSRLNMLKPFTEKMEALITDLSSDLESIDHKFLRKREVKRVGLVVVTGDKGLCGSFNANVLSEANKFLVNTTGKHVRMVTIGTKATTFFKRRRFDVYASFPNASPDPAFSQVKTMIEAITALFTDGGCEEVHMIYTHFVNTMVYRTVVNQILPLPFGRQAASKRAHTQSIANGAEDGVYVMAEDGSMKRHIALDFIFEPSRKAVLASLLPRYVKTKIYISLIEAITSEHSARMIMMSNATDKAEEMIDELTLHLNKARQEMITNELIDIVGGAEALKD
jgi:F-type H+-transporting ATPase subunit gamma